MAKTETADSKIHRMAEFIEEHQVCEEENTLVPMVAKDVIYIKCISCGDREEFSL